MPISLPSTLRNRLIEGITQALAGCSVVSGALLTYSSQMWSLHELVAKGSRTAQELESCLGDRHVTDFVQSELSRHRIGAWTGDGSVASFQQVLGAHAPREWAEDLVAALETLPWQYTAYAALPGQITTAILGGQSIELTSTVKVVGVADLPPLPSPPLPLTLGALIEERPEWHMGCLYTQMDFSGYISKNRESATVHQLINSTFSLYGVALASGLLVHHPWIVTTSRASIYGSQVFKVEGGGKTFSTSLDFDPSHVKELDRLGHFAGATDGATSVGIGARFQTIGRVLAKADRRLLNASRWFFDSHCGSSDQVRFVQICTALEILLGDERQGRETGLSTLMANRCAYLLGNSNIERSNILSGFKQGYDIRSKIVHAGKNTLSSAEKGHFHYMQQLCALVIRKECNELTT